MLRAKIVELEGVTTELIGVLERHLNSDSASAAGVARDVKEYTIPTILQRITEISADLNDQAEQGGLFAAEPAFKQLKIELDEKRSVTLCRVGQNVDGLTSAQRVAMKDLLADLRTELAAISDTESQLADFIRKPRNNAPDASRTGS